MLRVVIPYIMYTTNIQVNSFLCASKYICNLSIVNVLVSSSTLWCVSRQSCHISIPQFFVHIGCMVEKVCRFISAMNKVFPQDANIKKRVSPFLEELHKYPVSMICIRIIIFTRVLCVCVCVCAHARFC